MIGILGGTFDPIHFGHLRTALELHQALGLEAVRLLPCGLPPHRGRPQASPEQRLAMVEVAVAGQSGLLVDRRELERPGPSYMVDTLISLREDLGKRPLGLILGMDAFLGLPSWHHWERIPELTHLLVVTRPGAPEPDAGPMQTLLRVRETADPEALHGRPAGLALRQQVTRLDISSTAIRGLIAAGRSPRFLLPDAVLALIETHRLYRQPAAGPAND